MADAPTAGTLHVRIRQQRPMPLAVEFSAAPGTVLALVGPSGSGKTSTLRVIAGFMRPADGYVACGGEVWLDTAAGIDLPARRRRAGFVFQSYALFPHLSAVGNVMTALGDLPADTRRRQASAFLARVHLTGIDDRNPGQLSGGQQQRIAVARALARRPRVLLLDEPFSAVDRATRLRLQAEMMALRDMLSMPVVLVTHDLDEVARLADTVVLISDGRVAAAGPIATVLTRLDLGDVIDPDQLGAVMTARIVAHDPAMEVTHLAHPAGELIHPLVAAPVGATLRLRVHARDVALAVGELGTLSIRNRLHCTVTEIAERTGYAVDVRLDAGGDPLIARITREAARALDLRVGQPVVALIKSTAFDRLDDFV